MNGTMCPKCGAECASRFIIIHGGDDGREFCEEHYCEECTMTIRRLKIKVSAPIPVLH